ncbi:MAG: ISAs1 family transposase [Cyanobacteria bacterium]|nr:ISAs1 family transposase [Cyanobacteria bacterium GSL.Bin1]
MGKGFAPKKSRAQLTSDSKKKAMTSIETLVSSLSHSFEEVPDPRSQRTQKHRLQDILVIAILAVIAGAEGWEDLENYGLSKQQWLEEFLELPEGIPSDDTFRRLFEKLNPQALEQVLAKWLQQILGSLSQEVVPIDGKTLKGAECTAAFQLELNSSWVGSSYDRNAGSKALHLVTAWASEQRLVLGQVKVEDYSNEITAIPALLELIDLSGAIVTIDAMGTQTEIVRQLRQKNADYVLALKANHPTLYFQVQQWFETALATNFDGYELSRDRRVETGHHRREIREVWAVPLSAFGGLYQQEQWLGLQSIIRVERVRHLWNRTTHEVQYYLSSLPADAQLNGRAIREHWGIENRLHWTLDVTFNEDQGRIRSGHSPRHFALLRRMAINALNSETTLKRSLRQKIKRAAMNNDYMMTVLKAFCQA